MRKQSIYFAVKTCQKFHEDRLKVVKETWGKHAVHINFFSDKEGESVTFCTEWSKVYCE